MGFVNHLRGILLSMTQDSVLRVNSKEFRTRLRTLLNLELQSLEAASVRDQAFAEFLSWASSDARPRLASYLDDVVTYANYKRH